MLSRTLTDLPAELLMTISEHLEPTSFLSLSTLDRRLQLIFLPLFFNARGHELPTAKKAEMRLVASDMAILSGLQVSLWTTSLQVLSCTLTPGSSALFKELHLLHCLVERLEHLGRLNLNLVEVNFRDCSHEVRPVMLENWAHKLTALLNAVVSRPDTALTVVYGSKSLAARRHFRRLPRSRPPSREKPCAAVEKRCDDVGASRNGVFYPILRNIADGLRSLSPSHLKSPKQSRQSPEREQQIAIEYRDVKLPSSGHVLIEHLGIHSVVLLRPPFLQWTIQTLNAATKLSTLSLDNVALSSDLGGFSCISESDFLKSLTLPSLSKLVLGNCDIEWNDLIEFLGHHPSLVELDLYRNIFRSSSTDTIYIPSLPKLKSITATPEYLKRFLSSPSSLPELEMITMSSDYYGMPPYGYDYGRFLRVFPLLDAIHLPLHLELRFLSGIGLESWLSSVSGCDIGAMDNVHSLELGTDNRFIFTAGIVRALVSFIGCLFPCVRSVTFRAKCVFGDGKDGYLDCEDRVIGSLRRTCLNLRTVNILPNEV